MELSNNAEVWTLIAQCSSGICRLTPPASSEPTMWCVFHFCSRAVFFRSLSTRNGFWIRRMCSATISIAATTVSTTSTAATTTTSATTTVTTDQYCRYCYCRHYHYRHCSTTVTVAFVRHRRCSVCVCGARNVSNFSTFSPNRKQFETELHAELYFSGEERALRAVYPFPLSKVCLECLVNMLFSFQVVMQMWNRTY